MAACAGADEAPDANNLGVVSDASLCLLNGERSARGLGSLTANGLLGRAAVAHSAEMVSSGVFSHESPDGTPFDQRILAAGYRPLGGAWTVGENIAWGSGSLATPRSIVAAWMASAPHRANILEPDFQEIGVGVVQGTPSGDPGATYTTDFGARDRPVRIAARPHRKVKKRVHKRARAHRAHR
ncbi:MAG: CAP domain-containing protein [Actinomycetota bacterium]|nr:CAP domain-containing protein [Actinomycetota bacterium]